MFSGVTSNGAHICKRAPLIENPCDTGKSNCDRKHGICNKMGGNEFFCSCEPSYVSAVTPNGAHICKKEQTIVFTTKVTNNPTKSPTHSDHPCDTGKNNCDRKYGICNKMDGNEFFCSCDYSMTIFLINGVQVCD